MPRSPEGWNHPQLRPTAIIWKSINSSRTPLIAPKKDQQCNKASASGVGLNHKTKGQALGQSSQRDCRGGLCIVLYWWPACDSGSLSGAALTKAWVQLVSLGKGPVSLIGVNQVVQPAATIHSHSSRPTQSVSLMCNYSFPSSSPNHEATDNSPRVSKDKTSFLQGVLATAMSMALSPAHWTEWPGPLWDLQSWFWGHTAATVQWPPPGSA